MLRLVLLVLAPSSHQRGSPGCHRRRFATPDGQTDVPGWWVDLGLAAGAGRNGGQSVEAVTYVQFCRSYFSRVQARLRSLDSALEAHPISSADDMTAR